MSLGVFGSILATGLILLVPCIVIVAIVRVKDAIVRVRGRK